MSKNYFCRSVVLFFCCTGHVPVISPGNFRAAMRPRRLLHSLPMSTTRTVMLSVRQEPHRFMLATLGIVQVSIAMVMGLVVNDILRIQMQGRS